MKVALIQTHLFWENPAENRKNLQEKINAVSAETDLIVLPEMFSTGFTMNPKDAAESADSESLAWMKKVASEKNAAVVGSIAITENGKFYNRLYFVFPSGETKTYDKRHLFSLAGEDEIYTAGKEKLILEYNGWKLCPLICYDLRFPVFARNTEDYDLLLYVANWPDKRSQAWNSLLKARAIENMSYVVGVNRVGEDHDGFAHSGYSQVVDFLGEFTLEPQIGEGVFEISLDKKAMDEARKKYDFLSDRDQFELK